MTSIDNFITTPWQLYGYKPIYQKWVHDTAGYPGREPGGNPVGWKLTLPDVNDWTDQTLVIKQFYDFVTVIDGQCPELNALEKHYGEHANQVVAVHWNLDLAKIYRGPVQLIHFPCHSFEFIQQINHIQSLWENRFSQPRTHKWQCLNGRVSPHREKVAAEMQKFPMGILSLGDKIALPIHPYANYLYQNHINWVKLLPVYSDCDINVVTETIYDHAPGIVTEKTLMAILAEQVPIVIGYSGIVDHCEQLGFDMFRDIVDTSYDYMPNQSRWQQAIQLNQDLLRNGIDRSALQQRLIKNRKWAQSGWIEQLKKNHQRQVNEIHVSLTKRKDHHTM